MAACKPKYCEGDVVNFKFSSKFKENHNGVIITIWHRSKNKIIYEIASMNHGMCSYSIAEECVVKKISE